MMIAHLVLRSTLKGVFGSHRWVPMLIGGGGGGMGEERGKKAARRWASNGLPVRGTEAGPPTKTKGLLDGTAAAQAWLEELQIEVDMLKQVHGITPGLGVLVVGQKPDSMLYVNRKKSAGRSIGIRLIDINLPEESSEETIISCVRWLCSSELTHGVLVQLPLPSHINEHAILQAVDPEKDVDGLHPENAGTTLSRNSNPRFIQCAPLGCAELLRRNGITVRGKQVVVLGTTNTAGAPMALQLRDMGAMSVTLCGVPAEGEMDRDTYDKIQALARSADVLVSAVGQAGIVERAWVKPGAVVLDVGISITAMWDKKRARSFTVVGDVDFKRVSKVASFASPTPGGTGPMTVAALLCNVLRAAQRSVAM